jgi:2-succinyl-6-hydroxy-2,4-cyclohexadiene-1-carboxylate synthase
MTEIELNNVSYFYEAWREERPLLILLHGFTGSSQNWKPLLPSLTSHCQILTLDILGHGRSASPPDPTRYHMAQVAADIVTLLNLLTDQPAHLLGYSMGGRLALYLAVHYPERFASLILESASPGLKTDAEREERCQQDNTLANRIEREGIEAFVNFWESLPLWDSQKQLSPEIRAKLRQQRLQNNASGLANSLRGMGTGVQPSLWQNLPDFHLPTLVMTGELDKKFMGIAQEMMPLLPQANHVTAHDAGHTIHLEKPTQYTQTVVSFLKNAVDNHV